jgi:hypothetical protein
MKTLLLSLVLLTSAASAQTPLSDGKTFTGWEGDTTAQWRIEDGAFTAGSLEKKQPYNDYLATTKEFGDFELRLKWKLEGTEGFVNGGVQFRTKRIAPPSHEVIGFQADLGMGYDGALYDNMRRKTILARPSKEVLEKARKPVGEWNDYRIRAEGLHIQIWLNGVQTVDYTETDPAIATTGIIATQLHGNSNAIVRYKDFVITELPAAKAKAGDAIEPAAKTMLFDGESLDGWIPFSPGKEQGKDDRSTVANVWSVRDGVIHCEGKPNGYLRTSKDYANYQLHFEWRWDGKPTNSGVLLHKTGPDLLWPTSVEAQLRHENAGDFYLINLSSMTVNGQQLGPVVKPYLRAAKQNLSNEKPPGEWNSYDIVCDGDSIQLTVNGLLQNKGTGAKPSSGAICLQSEGSPIQFRNIYLKPLEK